MSRCASDCARSRCSRCIARAGRRRRWRPIGTHVRRSWRRSAWSPAPSCATCTRRSSARIPDSTRRTWSKRPDWRPSSTRRRRCWAGRPIWSGCVGTGGAHSPVTAGSCWSPASDGVGKTRLVAELAQEVLRDGGAVLYVPRLGGRVARGGRRSRGSRTDPAGARRRRERARSDRRATRRGGACGGDGGAGGALAAGRRDAGAQAAERRWRARLRPALCGRDGGRRRAGRAPAGSQRRLAGAAARRGVGVGAHAGAAPPRRFGRPHHRRPVRAARRRGRPRREHRQAPGRQGAHRVGRAEPRTGLSARTRGWPRSRPATRASSSGASGSWPSSSRA